MYVHSLSGEMEESEVEHQKETKYHQWHLHGRRGKAEGGEMLGEMGGGGGKR